MAGGGDGRWPVAVTGLRDLAQLFPEGDTESPKLSQLLVHRISGHVSWMPPAWSGHRLCGWGLFSCGDLAIA